MSTLPEFLETQLPSPITEFVCQVTSNINGEQHFASGTAVIVAPYLALGARHVFEDHGAYHEGHPPELVGEHAGRFSLVLGQIVGSELNLWEVTRIWGSGRTDIVVYRLTPYSAGARRYTFRQLTLDLLPPTVGERISAFGYHSNETETTEQGVVMRQGAATAHGTVLEVHDELRDRARLPFPCFRTNARFDGGMSGGPVFNSAGHLCGLICSNLPPASEGEEHASYVASLWPAMATPIDLDRVGHPSGLRYPMLQLVQDNFLAAKNADRIALGEPDESGSRSISLSVPRRDS